MVIAWIIAMPSIDIGQLFGTLMEIDSSSSETSSSSVIHNLANISPWTLNFFTIINSLIIVIKGVVLLDCIKICINLTKADDSIFLHIVVIIIDIIGSRNRYPSVDILIDLIVITGVLDIHDRSIRRRLRN